MPANIILDKLCKVILLLLAKVDIKREFFFQNRKEASVYEIDNWLTDCRNQR